MKRNWVVVLLILAALLLALLFLSGPGTVSVTLEVAPEGEGAGIQDVTEVYILAFKVVLMLGGAVIVGTLGWLVYYLVRENREDAAAMTQSLWTAVDGYFNATLGANDAALDHALEASRAAGLPAIAVAPNQGKLLNILARSIHAKAILEVGTLGGYSTIWLARALGEGGRLVTLELDAHHAEVARANLAFAGLSEIAQVRQGPALELLPILEAESGPPFDLVFIDADKESNADYFAWALKLTRPGGLIIVDNVVRGGRVVDPDGDAQVQGVRRLAQLVAAEPRVTATAIQTVGDKGHDGLLVAHVGN